MHHHSMEDNTMMVIAGIEEQILGIITQVLVSEEVLHVDLPITMMIEIIVVDIPEVGMDHHQIAEEDMVVDMIVLQMIITMEDGETIVIGKKVVIVMEDMIETGDVVVEVEAEPVVEA